MACTTSHCPAAESTSHCANRAGWIVNWSVFKPDSPQKKTRNHGAPTRNYHMEGNAAPSLHPLWSPLKIPLREWVVIRTHDSLITPMLSSRNTAQGVDTAGGWKSLQSVQLDWRLMQDGQHRLSPQCEWNAVNNCLCVVFAVVWSVGLLKRFLITVWSKDEQPYTKDHPESASFYPSRLINTHKQLLIDSQGLIVEGFSFSA